MKYEPIISKYEPTRGHGVRRRYPDKIITTINNNNDSLEKDDCAKNCIYNGLAFKVSSVHIDCY